MASLVAYTYPGSGTTPATAAQAAGASVQTATISFLDADTTVTVTHNWNFDTTALARGLPLIGSVVSAAGTAPALVAVASAANTVVFAKAAGAGTGGTFLVSLQRPHSILMPNQ